MLRDETDQYSARPIRLLKDTEARCSLDTILEIFIRSYVTFTAENAQGHYYLFVLLGRYILI